jgi:hypothetical protein
MWLCLTWLRFVLLVLASVADSPVCNACTQYFSNHPNRIHICQATHLTRRGRGLAPRSSALQLSQHLLGPKVPPPGIHILLAQVSLAIFSIRYIGRHFLTCSPRDLFG